MIIVITPEKPVNNETKRINTLFKKGLDLLHIRKYWYNDAEMIDYLKAINHAYSSRLVLHSHSHLAKDFGVDKIHFRELDRVQNKHLPYLDQFICSTSVHSIYDFNELSACWSYAFLSPVFPSISKQGYGVGNNVIETLKDKNNTAVKLIGLGGINESNAALVKSRGADGIALLGSIWQAKNPLNTFLKCKQIDQL